MSASRDVLIEEGNITIRRMRDLVTDYELLARWLTDDRVLEFYEGRDNPFPLARVLEHYGPMVRGMEDVLPCILAFDGTAIGYLQYYPVQGDEQESYRLGDVDAIPIFGIDLFIGEVAYWNRGIGTRALGALVRHVFQDCGAVRLVVDPHVENVRAIRCYEKCGFRGVRILPAHELHEGRHRDCLLMVIDH